MMMRFLIKMIIPSIIGSLRYVTNCTRPDIAYAVGVLSKFTSKPSKDHWLAIE